MIYPIVVGTAGHIDHGKTALVRALTGIDTDRLPVEKARGITTELGFARLDLGERRIAVVDVPGHERFVKSMVAGATGLDLVILVIAADEGVMPQTREHLDICDLLGVRRGVIALTKADLVDAEWLQMVTADVRAAVDQTFLAEAPIVPVSAKTGAGLDELRAELTRQLATLQPRTQGGVFRLPIDRVFTVKGFGTIVTGTVLGGEVAVGDELELIPTGLQARVRGLEVHGTAVEKARAGHRAAINLGGVGVDELARGDLVVHPGKVAGSHILDVELRYLASARTPLAPRGKVLVHHGTAQLEATLLLLDKQPLEPGATALAQLRLDRDTPLGALPGDRFILRGFVQSASGGSTIAGGRVIRVLAPKARNADDHARAVAELANARLDQRVALETGSTHAAGINVAELGRRIGATPQALAEPIARLIAGGELLAAGDHYIHATTIAELEHTIVGALADPDGIAREALRGKLPAALPQRAFDAIVDGLAQRNKLVAIGDRVRSASAPVRGALSPVEASALAKLKETGIEPPRPKELAAMLGVGEAQLKPVLDRLVAAKLAVKIKPDLIMHASIVEHVRTRLVAFLDQHGTIDAQQWKDLTGASRKFTIPLAEYFDGEKLTLRIGDVRRRR
ncbi:MAG TPA: selenocysteine-specific translation elongation factor [Kofleriaceae bacterium]|jgi:selenocysteine-specific elongation factor|nr:selenocysteine-specific translation elongation factor [Kofleriaceae bacterium]